jgi:hypothetical protein
MNDLFGENQQQQQETAEQLASAQQQSPLEAEQDEQSDDNGIVLKYGAKQVMMIFLPVSACMLLVIINLKLIKSYQSGNGVYL